MATKPQAFCVAVKEVKGFTICVSEGPIKGRNRPTVPSARQAAQR
jgi:hypothetical protein